MRSAGSVRQFRIRCMERLIGPSQVSSAYVAGNTPFLSTPMKKPYRTPVSMNTNGYISAPRSSRARYTLVSPAISVTSTGAIKTKLAGWKPWCRSTTRRTNGVKNQSAKTNTT